MAELLGAFEQAVLVAIVDLGRDAYGRTVLHRVEELLKRSLSAGAVYTTLERLEKRGLIRSKLEAGTPVRGGRPRRYYTVAAEGIRALNEAHQSMTALWGAISWPVKVTR